ncbi:NAD-dependent epimerase/dehydratase family protein, partial [Myxococcota bacterium]|nr:NAD-dependent epimerase/dehydratase family protein [Myxococcota bacterium]
MSAGDPKRVLVTGATGFIGLHTLAPLLARGYEVHAVSSREPRSGSTAPGPAGRPTGVVWHRADLLAPGTGAGLLAEVKPSHLLHLAWYVVPGKLITAPENFAWVAASMDLIRHFAVQGGRRFAVCGSGYEYDWSYGYCSEKRTPAVPNTVYGACKQALHLMAESFAEQAGLSATWGRVFFLYGPNEHPDRLVSSVIRSILRGEPARCSHGRQIRDYMHVQDVADGLVALLDSDVRGAVNVSSGEATTLREIVLTIGRLTGRSDLIQLGALPARANDTALVVG